MSISFLLLLAAVVLFILAIFVNEHEADLLYAGLAAFAAAHFPPLATRNVG